MSDDEEKIDNDALLKKAAPKKKPKKKKGKVSRGWRRAASPQRLSHYLLLHTNHKPYYSITINHYVCMPTHPDTLCCIM